MRIWLAYVSDYYTTANYVERALREDHEVITIGPYRGEVIEVIADGIKKKIGPKKQDIQTPIKIDLEVIAQSIPQEFLPDLFLWVESAVPFETHNMKSLGCPTACYLIDSHLNINFHKMWAKNFDYVFLAQREYVEEFKEAGVENVFWLPLGCDPGIHGRQDVEEKYDITFVGGVKPGSRREKLLHILSQNFEVFTPRTYREEMAKVYSAGKTAFNNAIKNDLNMRVFEALCAGTLLITDEAANSGQEELFIDGKDLVIYQDDKISETFKEYLENDEKRKKIARQGRDTVLNAHTYYHRFTELVNVASGKKETTPTAAEWRERSQSESGRKTILRGKESQRSFIVAVLDYSPDSPYNIKTLLTDLERIDGTVIAVFNSPEVADQVKNHPRIDRYAILSHNVGVSRAWNTGLNIAETPVSFILNSDLTLSNQAVRTLEKALYEFDDTAITGPEGSFFNFFKSKDYKHFRKSQFVFPTAVDAVSGFFFAVKTELFNQGILKFDNAYTPCYFEEWDLGLQVRDAGLKSYIIPTFGYDHEFNIVKQKNRKIQYYEEEEPVGVIHARNQEYFWRKWLGRQGINELKDIDVNDPRLVKLHSSFPQSYITEAKRFIEQENMKTALALLRELIEHFPAEADAFFLLGNIAEKTGNKEAAVTYYKKALEIKPEHLPSAKKLKELT